MKSVQVDVYADEFDDSELVAVLQERGYSVLIPTSVLEKQHKWEAEKLRNLQLKTFDPPTLQDDLTEIKNCLEDGRVKDALALIDVLMFPKFKTIDACEQKYRSIKNTSGDAPSNAEAIVP